jgi:amino acid adenylation domain-containing protein
LRALAESAGFQSLTPQQSLFNIFATALAAFVMRVSADREFALGVMTHGRISPDARRTPGLHAELFPLDVALPEGASFRALNGMIAEEAFTLLRHASRGASSAAGQARFNVILNYIRVRFENFAGKPAKAEWLHPGAGDPRHALRLSVLDFSDAEELALSFDINTALLEAPLPDRLPKHFERLLDAMLDDPDLEVGRAALALDGEASVSLTESTATLGAREAVSPPPDVLRAFAERVVEAPSAVVIRGEQGTISRADLDAWSSALAESLAAAGVRQGDRVGLHMTRSGGLVAAILGVLKLGAAYVPLDPLQPLGRLDAIVDQARPKVVVTERELMAAWPCQTARLCIEDAPRRATADWAAPEPGAGTLAYVIFTSGSTGIPKGVSIGRAALSRYAAWAQETFAEGRPKAWSLHSSIGFDLTVTSIFAPLVGGGEIVTYREALPGPDLSILRVFRDDAVDIVKLTPSHLALALEAGCEMKRIGVLVLGGEDLGVALATRALDRAGGNLRIVNEYGPTEATVGCMIHTFDPERDRGASVPIGRPAAATAIYLLDEGLNPVPDQVIGELYVSGPDRLAECYWEWEEETKARFLPDPFAPGRRMYRTGDLASIAPNGVIAYHGRADEQVKIRGVRIELAEIRRSVLEHPAVTDCAIGTIARAEAETVHCRDCGLDSSVPEAEIDETGLCSLCRDYGKYKDRATAYFKPLAELEAAIAAAARRKTGDFDCLMLLSGGKDSTYALCRLAEITPRILTATLDNGFISEEAKANIRKVTAALGVEHRFLSTPAMNAIFVDSLKRHANVCNGCFKTIYTLGVQEARKEGIPAIVTGLSRGQLFETRLAPELFQDDAIDAKEIDRITLEARKTYHRLDDAATRLLDCSAFESDAVFEEISFIDFYRYCDVSLDEVYAYLAAKAPWARPKDTGRSTNCLINDVGIHLHKRRRGFHNYALPYSWDVRMGHKERAAALEELDDEIDEARVRGILDEIGFDESIDGPDSASARLVCHFTAEGPVDLAELRGILTAHLPREMIPSHFVQVPAIPLTQNGKVDTAALPRPRAAPDGPAAARSLAPRSPAEKALARIWAEVLGLESFGVDDNFFDLGGDSIAAIRIAARACESGFQIGAVDLFQHQTVASLATVAQRAEAEAEVAPAAAPKAVLDPKARAKLAALFGERSDE